MSQRRTTVPPTRKHSPSSTLGRKGLIAKEKPQKQSAKRRTVLDNHFHRTVQRFTCAARARVPKPMRRTACTHVSRAMQAARRRDGFDVTRRFSAGPKTGRVGFYLELGGGIRPQRIATVRNASRRCSDHDAS